MVQMCGTSASLYVMYMVEGPPNTVYPFSGMGAIYSKGSRFFRDAEPGSDGGKQSTYSPHEV